MNNDTITLRSYLHVKSRKKNDKGKLVINVLTKNLKIQPGDYLTVEIKIYFGGIEKYAHVTNNTNGLTRNVLTTQLYRMLSDSCETEEYLII